MDILTTEDQKYFYDYNIDTLTEDFENSSVHTRQPEIAETVMLEKFIKIDGIRYAFRHLIKGYKSNSIQNILSINKSAKIPVLNIERANNTQINPFYKDGNNINEMLDDESISSSEEETMPSLIDDIKMRSLENDLMFNLNYGVSFLTPPNFVVRKDEIKLDLKSIFKPHLPGEKELAKRHFAGWYSKLYFDSIKRPDKALVKKYANPDQISSTGRDRSTSPHGSLQRSKTKNILFLPSEITSEMTSMQETFEKYKSDHLENKLICIEKYYNFQEIINSFKDK